MTSLEWCQILGISDAEEARKTMARKRLIDKVNGRMCVLCGGRVPADSIEHAPPIILFKDKDRPGGLEVPACRRCNNGSSQLDQMASLVFRVQSYASVSNQLPVNSGDMRRLLKGVSNNYPKSLGSKLRKVYIQPKLGDLMDAFCVTPSDGVLTDCAKWAAKQVLALWYICTAHNKIASENATIDILLLTNADDHRAALYKFLSPKLGEIKFLRQGSKTSAGQFEYQAFISPDERYGVFMVIFHNAGGFIGLLRDPALKTEKRKMFDFTFKTKARCGIYQTGTNYRSARSKR